MYLKPYSVIQYLRIQSYAVLMFIQIYYRLSAIYKLMIFLFYNGQYEMFVPKYMYIPNIIISDELSQFLLCLIPTCARYCSILLYFEVVAISNNLYV